ncbi:hypothetical protein PLICRDRAFT_30247 [Plicaturopsis crispa FD-325 SS-3]|nr:hypothetical protein PLICRDRAFT_30247 [Plicaturopsis crispa FD-325 SS-3]
MPALADSSRPYSPCGDSESTIATRVALTRALSLARLAVHLDGLNEDPHGAIDAYSRSTTFIAQVIERLSAKDARIDDGHDCSSALDVEKLKHLHDTYLKRMDVLRGIYCSP